MSDCPHPFNEVTDETAIIRASNGTIERSESSGSIRITVSYCQNCNHIVDSEFGDSYPISRLNKVVQTHEECEHAWDAILETELYLDVQDKPYAKTKHGQQARQNVTICTDCEQILNSEYDAILIITP